MKLLITGDWHLDTQNPENRIDDYPETQFDKIRWIYKLANDNGCFIILQPGDVFNSHRANDYVKQRYINMFRAMTRQKDDIAQPPHLYTIYGQHDLRYHSSDRQNTPLAVMEAAEVCAICQEDPYIIDWSPHSKIFIYGCNWGEDIPPRRKSDGVHILLMHKLVVADREGWEDNYLGIDDVFEQSDHDIIVCGDNHHAFMAERFHEDYPDRLLFNCGSLMRSRVDQKEHKPVVYIVDTTDLQWEEHFIPVKPIEEVLDLETAERKKKRNEQLESFVNTLSTENVEISGLDFRRNVYEYCKANNVDQATMDFINEVMS